MRRAILMILALPLAGCVSLSGGACSPEEWRAAGFADGAEGAPSDPSTERRASCEKKARGAAPDVETYLAGWRDGRDSFCTAKTGFAVGVRGQSYRRICEGESEERFLAAYEKGKRLFALQASAIRAERAMSRAQSRLWEIRRRMSEIEAITVSTALSHEERLDLTGELRSLRSEKQRTEAALAGLAEQKARAAAALADYRSILAAEDGALRPSNASF